MCFLFRKPPGEIVRGAFVFCNFIIILFQLSCKSVYKILEQSSENTFEVSSVEDMLSINDKKQSMENDTGHCGLEVVRATHNPGSLFVMTKAFTPESLCSSLLPFFSPPMCKAQCPVSAAVTKHECVGCSSEPDLHQQRFQSAVLTIAKAHSSE